MGGELELVARFPGQPEVRVHVDEFTGESADSHDREAIAWQHRRAGVAGARRHRNGRT